MGLKETYQDKVSARLKELDAQVEKVLGRADKATAEAQAKSREQLEELRNKQQQARAKLKELEGAGESAWEDIRAGTEEAMTELRSALTAARSRFQ
ncbi:MAG: hypothetical protein AMJ93_08685 [Anaerolineae bacterium SM23_84]|nr:MAG: hypothetical protein AMJ93_08685 [Anaerolineae bacterium SM23_84]